jgi:hypothetical protein
VTDFRDVVAGEWRILVEDQIADEAYELVIEQERATFTGETGVVAYAETSAIASFPSGASIDLNNGFGTINPNPATRDQKSFPILLRYDDAVEAFGFMFRPNAVPSGAGAPEEG